MNPHRNDFDIAAELRALRPTPQPQFAAELDARAAAGFPRGQERSGSLGKRTQETLGRLSGRLRISPRRLIGPAAGAALAAIAVATVVVVSSEDTSTQNLSKPVAIDKSSGTRSPQGSGALLQMESPQNRSGAAAGTSAPSAVPEKAVAGDESLNAYESKPETGPYASEAGRRDIERSAELVLGTEASEMRDASAKVFSTVHTYDGIVLRSSIEDGAEGDAEAEFDLLIPSAKLGDALASFSRIAEVRSRHEATADVTARTIGLGERLQDARARVKSLLGELAEADTEAERVSVEAQLRSERFRVAALRSHLSSLERRTNFSHLSLRIESGDTPAAGQDEDGGWGLGNALDDAGRILEVAAGVTLLALAILSPLALLALILWLSRRTWVRKGRERALG